MWDRKYHAVNSAKDLYISGSTGCLKQIDPIRNYWKLRRIQNQISFELKTNYLSF